VPATEALSRMAQALPGSDAQLKALKQMMGLVRQQAVVMRFADVFLMLTVLFLVLAGLGVLMRKPAPVAAGAGGH
jgi:DHA2 family multidrug resistance protein